MRRTRSSRQSSRAPRPQPSPEEAADIDARYGLEPVFEPSTGEPGDGGDDRGGLEARTRAATVHCPYCGEAFETLLDLSAGAADYIEDCQVCCQPIEFSLGVEPDGRLAHLRVRRGD